MTSEQHPMPQKTAYQDLITRLDGIKTILAVTIPTLTVHTLSDDQVFANTALAYQAVTAFMQLATSIVMSRTGHFHEMWQSDPFWADQVSLIYFKRMLAPTNAAITATVPFPSLGPSNENAPVMHIPLGPGQVEKLLSADSIVPYLHDVCY